MSIKTLRKRIALVAVSALGVGLLSVAPASAAVPTASTLFVASTASNTGGAVNADNDQATMKSVGWISKTSTNGTAADNGFTLTGSLAGTGVVFAGAKIAFSGRNAAEANSDISFVVTGGTISGVVDNTGGTTTLNGSATVLVAVGDGDATAEDLGGVFNVSAAAGSTVTISQYVGTAITADAPTSGTLSGTWTFTVASASVAGVYNAGQSQMNRQAHVSKGTVAAGTDTWDSTARGDNGTVGLIYVALKDAYASAITSGTIAVSATNSATVKIANAASDTGAEAYAATTSFDSTTPVAAMYIYVNQPTAGVAGETTVTISLDGAVLGSKTIQWNGVAASITIDKESSASVFRNGYAAYASYVSGTSAGFYNVNIVYVIKDAAGNVLNLSDQPTLSDQTGSMLGASLSAATDTTGSAAAGTVDTLYQLATNGYGLATMLIPSSTLRGAGTYKLKYVNSVGTTIKSDEISATVSGSLYSFTASWDKASYNPGDIATLTISGKDSGGRPVADGMALGADASVTTNTDGLEPLSSACSTANIETTVFAGGVRKCKFAVGNTPGAYSYNAYVATGSDQAAEVGAVKIVASTTSVTNAEVLAAIVKLIASINEQIALLQKQLKKATKKK